MSQTGVPVSAQELISKKEKFIVPAVTTYYDEPLVMEHGEGCYLFDGNGSKYLDFFGGILTVSVGHSRPEINAAISDQLQKLTHVSTLYVTKPMIDLAEKLAEITPGELKKTFFTASGTEADETAVAMARIATGSYEVVALRHSYSGRSALAMSLTGQAPWRLGMPSIPGIVHAMNAYCYRCPFGKTPQTCGLECAKDIENVIQTSTSGRIAAFIAEPIQGVGGFITPPDDYFFEVAKIIRKYGGVFISDEVQTGFGRTGKPFGINHYGVEPDIMTFAKGIGNGLPVGAAIATDEVANAFKGPSISTFGGNPVAMRAALATLDVMEKEQLTDHAREYGRQLREGLEDLRQRYPIMGDVRGKGLMQGVEFVRLDKEPAPDLANMFLELTKRNGLLIGKGGLYGNAIRIAPPMTVSGQQIRDGLDMMEASLKEMYTLHRELQEVTSTD